MDECGESAVISNFAHGTLVMWMAATLVMSGTTACGGGPSSGSLHDGAGMSAPAPTAEDEDAGTDGASSGPSLPRPGPDCANPEQGCPCDQPGETVACHTPVFRDGNYVTCAGARACISGVWGPCWPPNYQTAGSSAPHR